MILAMKFRIKFTVCLIVLLGYPRMTLITECSNLNTSLFPTVLYFPTFPLSYQKTGLPKLLSPQVTCFHRFHILCVLGIYAFLLGFIKLVTGNSLVVQQLGLCVLTVEGPDSIPGQKTKNPQAMLVAKQNKTNKQTKNNWSQQSLSLLELKTLIVPILKSLSSHHKDLSTVCFKTFKANTLLHKNIPPRDR